MIVLHSRTKIGRSKSEDLGPYDNDMNKRLTKSLLHWKARRRLGYYAYAKSKSKSYHSW